MALAASLSLALATTFLPRLSCSLPLTANAYGFETVTETFVPFLVAAGAIVAFGPPVRSSA